MLYRYDKKKSTFKMFKAKTYFKLVGFFVLVYGMSLFVTYKYGITSGLKRLSAEERVLFLKKNDQFNQDKLVSMMKGLNVKYPWILMAQSILETGHWKSQIFLENNNLFGMKEAKTRITTSLGTQNNHSYYDTWRESVYDYAFYQSRYLGNVNSEQDYFDYIQATYSETPSYVQQLKKVIQDFKLKEAFQ